MPHKASPRLNFNLLASAFVFLIAFLTLGILVKYTDVFSNINNKIYNYLQSMHTPFLDHLFIFASSLGGPRFVNVVAACITLWLVYHRYFRAVVHLWANLMIATWLVDHTKMWFNVNRPLLTTSTDGAGSSFPSGHSLIIFVLFIFISWLLTQQLPAPKRYFLFIIYCLPAFVVCFSRIYLGDHWLTDVVGGFFISAVISAGSICVYRYYTKTTININKSLIMVITISMLLSMYRIEHKLNNEKPDHIQMQMHD